MIELLHKYPRLYLNATFAHNGQIPLTQNQAHYLKNVLRKDIGDILRVFNGNDGEWLAEISLLSKKNGAATLKEKIKSQITNTIPIHLLFAPIKKQRLDILIEKAIELGADALHPVITNRTENRKLNMARTRTQIIEAAEQCERLDIPTLNEPIRLGEILRTWNDTPIYACLERGEAKPLTAYSLEKGAAFLIGPEGGFDNDELNLINTTKNIRPVTLGQNILRAETATTLCLSYAYLHAAPQTK